MAVYIWILSTEDSNFKQGKCWENHYDVLKIATLNTINIEKIATYLW